MGSTRVLHGRSIRCQITQPAVQHRFEAGRKPPSRPAQSLDQNLRPKPEIFKALVRRSGLRLAVHCCCNPHRANWQPGCMEFFSAARSVLGQVDQLPGMAREGKMRRRRRR
ncbi:hypothetical protein VaNZ11_002938, partial [Volvox africanus]